MRASGSDRAYVALANNLSATTPAQILRMQVDCFLLKSLDIAEFWPDPGRMVTNPVGRFRANNCPI